MPRAVREHPREVRQELLEPQVLQIPQSRQGTARGARPALELQQPPHGLPVRELEPMPAQELQKDATLTEPIYGARYGELDISRELAGWRAPPKLPGLAAPPPNRYVPTDLTIKAPPARIAGCCTRPAYVAARDA